MRGLQPPFRFKKMEMRCYGYSDGHFMQTIASPGGMTGHDILKYLRASEKVQYSYLAVYHRSWPVSRLLEFDTALSDVVTEDLGVEAELHCGVIVLNQPPGNSARINFCFHKYIDILSYSLWRDRQR